MASPEPFPAGLQALIARLRDNIARVYLGNPAAIDRVLCCLLARGHLLIEDVPGVGKTVLATALARSIDCSFSRIQLTPDLLPSDVLGTTVFDRNTGQFNFTKGPIFAHVVLADEMNRTPPRTQSALLEAMSEATVSIDGKTFPLDPPFMVIATQNPYEYEGTYLLPENQLDRFLMRISLGYPAPAEEARVLSLRPSGQRLHELKPAIHRSDVLALQSAVDQVRVDQALLDYIVSFANATRRHASLQVGLSPRGALALAQAARATAVMQDRDYVIPEDITFNIPAVCPHRVIPRSNFTGGAEAAEHLLATILQAVASPI